MRELLCEIKPSLLQVNVFFTFINFNFSFIFHNHTLDLYYTHYFSHKQFFAIRLIRIEPIHGFLVDEVEVKLIFPFFFAFCNPPSKSCFFKMNSADEDSRKEMMVEIDFFCIFTTLSVESRREKWKLLIHQ